MIYQPQEVFDLRLALGGALLDTLWALAIDFIAEDNKEWSYYAGVALGNAAAATGIKGAAATLYAIGDTVDVTFFHSPDSSLVRIFLDGVLEQEVDLWDPTPKWLKRTIQLGSAIEKRIDIVNYDTSPQASGNIAWMGLSTASVVNGSIERRTGLPMAIAIVSIQLQDADGDTKSIPVHLPRGTLTLANFQAFATAFAPLLDAVTAAKINEMTITLPLTLPAGLKTDAVADSEVERGALFNCEAANTTYSHGVFIPAWKSALFTGDEVDLAGTGVAAFRDAFVTGLTDGATPLPPSDKYENDLTALNKATKRFRK